MRRLRARQDGGTLSRCSKALCTISSVETPSETSACRPPPWPKPQGSRLKFSIASLPCLNTAWWYACDQLSRPVALGYCHNPSLAPHPLLSTRRLVQTCLMHKLHPRLCFWALLQATTNICFSSTASHPKQPHNPHRYCIVNLNSSITQHPVNHYIYISSPTHHK